MNESTKLVVLTVIIGVIRMIKGEYEQDAYFIVGGVFIAAAAICSTLERLLGQKRDDDK